MSEWANRLANIYGSFVATQQARYDAALRRFGEWYGPGQVMVYRVPGRVNLIGEHTDYQQGYVLPVALDKDFVFIARRRDDAQVRLHNMEAALFPPRQFTGFSDIAHAPAGDWENYIKGATQMLWQKAGRPLCGADILVAGAPPHGVPRGAGLSSSSALTVGAAYVLAHLNELPLSPAELAWLCGEAEWYVGTRGGIMDQFIALLGRQGHALFLDCRASGQGPRGIPQFHTMHVPLPRGYNIIVADSKVRHDNIRSDFNVRVAEDRIGVALLKRRFPYVAYLRDLEGMAWADIEPLLPETLSEEELQALGLRLEEIIDVKLPRSGEPFHVRARCRHVVSENARVRASVAALRDGDALRFGQLMNEAHASVRDDYGASRAELEVLIRLAREVDGVVGARLTGAGWGGCIVVLAREGCEADFAAHVAPRYARETGLEPDIFVCHAGDGAGVVGQQVIG